MTMDDIVSYLEELSNVNNIYIGITKYPLYVTNHIHITVVDMNYGISGDFVSNLTISGLYQEKEFIIFKKFCLQCIEYIKKKAIQFKNNVKYDVVSCF